MRYSHARLFASAATALALVLPARGQVLTPVEQLGKALFFDNISQPAASQSCASCHGPTVGWTGPIAGNNLHGAVYRGAMPTRFGNRKPPSSAYATYAPVFHYDQESAEFVGGVFWDGRATGQRLGNPAAEQALGPFLNPVEQNMPSARRVCEHVAASRYAKLFVQTWGPGSLDCSAGGYAATYDKIGLSIMAYEASVEMSPFSSKFDAYWKVCRAMGNSASDCGLANGAQSTLDPSGILTEQEFAGLLEFGEYCSACHISHIEGPGGRPPLFTNSRFDNIGVPRNPDNPFYKMDKVYLDNGAPINPEGAKWVDRGLGDFLRSIPEFAHLANENDGKFRTPTVRNVDARPGKGFPKAYMHNGSLKSLEEVVSFYNTRDVTAKKWPPPEVDRNVNREFFEGKPLGNFALDADDEAAIVEFLKTLTDGWTPPKAKK